MSGTTSTIILRYVDQCLRYFAVKTGQFQGINYFIVPIQLSRIGDASQFPGPIDNGGLFAVPNGVSREVVNGHADGSNGPLPTLKERLCDELDYVLVPQEGMIAQWQGFVVAWTQV